MDTQPTTPVFTVTTADELPINIVVETPSGSRTKTISNLDDPGIKNRFAHIQKVKESLAAEYRPSDPHKFLIKYTSRDGDVSKRCSGGEGPFEKYLHEFRQRGGWNLRVIVTYHNGPGSSQPETVQKEAERLLQEKRSENFNKKFCLLETVLLSTLFGDGDIFGRLSAQDPILSQRLKEDLNLANEIRDKGKKLLALMILAKVENLGETFFDFWDESYRDESMPLSLETRPSFCDSDVWEAMRLYEDQLLVAELKSLKEKKCLHDFWEGQLLPLAEKERIDGGGSAEIYKVRLIDDHPELYGIYVVGKSEFPLVLDHNVLISLQQEDDVEEYVVNPPLAIKELIRRQEHTSEAFKQETDILVRLSLMNEPHIITLITAFRHGRQYYLVFPLAECSLQDLCTKQEPERSLPHITWLLRQMAGITRALNTIHNEMKASSKNLLEPTESLRLSQQQQQQDPERLAVPQGQDGVTAHTLRYSKGAKGISGEQLIGYHHDLALSNLLVFRALHVKLEGFEKIYGRIVLSDFGLGKLRRLQEGTRTGSLRGQPNYMAPEGYKLLEGAAAYQDRKKDIWGLGCIFLQILVWLEGGIQALDMFESSR